MDERHAQRSARRSHGARGIAVDRLCDGFFVFGLVDGRVGRGVDDS